MNCNEYDIYCQSNNKNIYNKFKKNTIITKKLEDIIDSVSTYYNCKKDSVGTIKFNNKEYYEYRISSNRMIVIESSSISAYINDNFYTNDYNKLVDKNLILCGTYYNNDNREFWNGTLGFKQAKSLKDINDSLIPINYSETIYHIVSPDQFLSIFIEKDVFTHSNSVNFLIKYSVIKNDDEIDLQTNNDTEIVCSSLGDHLSHTGKNISIKSLSLLNEHVHATVIKK